MLMKGWLYQFALLTVHFALNSQQAITKQGLETLTSRNAELAKVAWILDQKVANMFGSKDEENWPFPNVNGGHSFIFTL